MSIIAASVQGVCADSLTLRPGRHGYRLCPQGAAVWAILHASQCTCHLHDRHEMALEGEALSDMVVSLHFRES